MMILKYLGHGLSALLMMSGAVFYIIAMYVGLKYTNMLNPTQKSIKLNVRYSLLGGFTFMVGAWVFIVTESGFSWKTLVLIAGGILAVSFLVILQGYIAGRGIK